MRELTRKYKFNDLYSSVKAVDIIQYLFASTDALATSSQHIFLCSRSADVCVGGYMFSLSPASLDSGCVHSPVIFRISNGVHAIRFSS